MPSSNHILTPGQLRLKTAGLQVLLSVIALIMTLLPAGCAKEPPVWSQAVKTPYADWTPEEKVVFAADSQHVADTHPQRMIVFMRYRNDCNVRDIGLIFEYESDLGSATDSITLPLFRHDGTPAGRSSLGVLETTDTLTLPFPVTPGWEAVAYPKPVIPAPSGILTIGITLLP